MATETISENDSEGWRAFLRRHWMIFALFVVAVVLAFIGAVYVFVWFAGEAQSIGLVPSNLGFWSLGNVVGFILHALFWELLLIGIPVAIAAVIGWQWWKRLPNEEKRQYHFFGKGSRTAGGSGVSFLFFVAFCIKVYLDGNWDVAIATWSLNYVIDSMITILIWGAVIFGIPAIIIGLIWLNREITKKP